MQLMRLIQRTRRTRLKLLSPPALALAISRQPARGRSSSPSPSPSPSLAAGARVPDGCIRKARWRWWSRGGCSATMQAPPLPGTARQRAGPSPANLRAPVSSVSSGGPPSHRADANLSPAVLLRATPYAAPPSASRELAVARPHSPWRRIPLLWPCPRISATGNTLRRAGFVTLPRHKTRRRRPIMAHFCNLAGHMYVSSTVKSLLAC
jgi:hypothetical protein